MNIDGAASNLIICIERCKKIELGYVETVASMAGKEGALGKSRKMTMADAKEGAKHIRILTEEALEHLEC